MVKSGLVDVPHVSQYRLTAHLGLALVIFACMLWFAMDFLRGETKHAQASVSYRFLTALVCGLVLLMMLSGGFVAGTKAGFIYNTFPTMNGQWVPDSWLAMSPWWRNLFENPVAIQFVHRCLAIIVAVAVLLMFRSSLRQPIVSRSSWVLGVLVLQIGLGISALLMVVPVSLGAAHQAGAVALLSTSLFTAHIARKRAAPNQES